MQHRQAVFCYFQNKLGYQEDTIHASLDSHCPLRAKQYNFGSSLTFPLSLTGGKGFRLAIKISQHLQDGLATHFVPMLIVTR